MATATLSAAADAVGPVQGAAAILALTGTCTAGGVIVMVRPQGGDTYYPSAFISASMIQQVPNVAGSGYGFVHGVQIPGGGHAKAVASAAFAGSLSAEILPADHNLIAAGGAGLGVLGDSAAVPVAQSADADLTAIGSRASDVTIALAAGASNIMTITVTAVDANGATVTGVHELELWMSESAVGVDLTADTYSGTLVAVTGTIFETIVAKKRFTVLTHTTGVFVGSLTDTAKPADQYVAVKQPVGAALKVSAASGTSWGA